MNKYIFLDVDGVLNTLNGDYKRFCGVNVIEEKLLLLKRLVETTNAEIVLSSSWRNYPTSREYVKKVLGAAGLSYKDCTPDFEGEKTRGGEISAWLSAQSQLAEISYVILDDYPPAQFIGHEGCFVNVNFKKGLTAEDVDKAVKILNEAPTVFTVPCNKPFVVTREEAEEMGLLKPQRCLTPEERAEIKRRADRWRKPDKKGDFRMNIAYKFKCTGCSHTWETYTTDRCLYPIENTVEQCKICGCMRLLVCSGYDDIWQEINFAEIIAKRDTRAEENLQILIAQIQELQRFQESGSDSSYEVLKAELIEKLQLYNIELS